MHEIGFTPCLTLTNNQANRLFFNNIAVTFFAMIIFPKWSLTDAAHVLMTNHISKASPKQSWQGLLAKK
jgi:hypothetical protein